jgi:hypothetical protein
MAAVARAMVLVLALRRAADPASPVETAQALLAGQLQLIRDPAATLATLGPNALVLGNGSFAVGHTREALAIIAELAHAPSGLPPLSVQVESIEAAGQGDALWLSAHVTMLHSGWRGRGRPEATTARIVELAVQDGTA